MGHDAEGFDIIGDVHGNHAALVALLGRLGYARNGHAWRHPKRRAVFVGDLIDRGHHQVEVLTLVRTMVDTGTAHLVAGNHEFNAVAFHTRRTAGTWCRAHSPKNLRQHAAFLEAVGHHSAAHDEWITWFRHLPLWLDLGGLRVVHACWNDADLDILRPLTGHGNRMTRELVIAASDGPLHDPATGTVTQPGSAPWTAIEHTLKGPEIPIEPAYIDRDGHRRDHARFAWWHQHAHRRRHGIVLPDGVVTEHGMPYPPLDDTPIEPLPVQPYTDTTPLVFGHYWRTGKPTLTSTNTACVDYSAGRGGPLVAYRWSGEHTLDEANLIASSG